MYNIFKKLSCLLLGLIMLFALNINAFAASATRTRGVDGGVCVKSVPASSQYQEPLLNNYVPSERAYGLYRANTVIDVLAPCDQEWRKLSSWATKAKSAVTASNTFLGSEFGFTLSPTTVSYTSSGSNSSAMLNNLMNQYGSTWQALVFGFSKAKITDNEVAGRSFIGGDYAIIFNSSYNSEVVQHELGHTYDLFHCEDEGSGYDPNVCVMAESQVGNRDQLCTSHWDDWYNNKNYHG